MLYARVTSPYLADSDHSDYLVDQLQDIGDVCSTSIPNITVRSIETYIVAPSPTSINFASTTASGSVVTATCLGQTVTADGSSCDSLSQKYGVTTGDLQILSANDDCSFTGSQCVPLPCSLEQTSSGQTW
jgi:hypothetical protein